MFESSHPVTLSNLSCEAENGHLQEFSRAPAWRLHMSGLKFKLSVGDSEQEMLPYFLLF